jgi:hypothetical protein
MTGPGKEWIFVVVFFAAFIAVTLADLYWLSLRKMVPIRPAMTVIFSSNFLTITLGFLVSFLIFGLLLAAVSNDGAQMPLGNVGTWAAFMAALAFPYLLMAGARRGLISLLRIEQITKPVSYSLISALVFFAAVIGLPVAFLFLF